MSGPNSHTYRSLQLVVIMLGLLLIGPLGVSGSQTFHSGGAAQCSGCHSMHNPRASSQRLLLSSDPSSICLNCHAGTGGPSSPAIFSPDGSALTPGGDFYWLTRDFSWDGGQSYGYDHGHNIVAVDYNLSADPVHSQAPGGTYSAQSLGCTSCHDPHGQVQGGSPSGTAAVTRSGSYGGTSVEGTTGNFRLLGDSDYTPPGGAQFGADAPIARQSSVRKFQETDDSHVDYGSGMSAWCGNCHADMESHKHRSGTSSFSHPTRRRLGNNVISTYNSYVKTGDFSGLSATAYLQFVPFERGVSDPQQLDPHSTQGPGTNAAIMCLSCHRAHGSAFDNISRWDFNADLLVDSHPAVGDVGASSDDVYYSYYGRDIAAEFGSGQRQFCEKCHG